MDDIEIDSIYTYQIAMPDGVNEVVTPCFCGYTIYINQNLSYEQKQKAFNHALLHIKNNDFEKDNVQSIEAQAHTH